MKDHLPRREPRPAAAAQAGVGDDLDDVVGLHVERLAQLRVPAGGDVVVVPDDLALVGVEGMRFMRTGSV